MRILRLAMAQMNPTVGAIKDNSRKIIRFADKARKAKADLVVFPELAISGYPPEDLLLKPAFIEDNLKALKSIAKGIKETAAIVGFIDREGEHIYNAAAVIYKGNLRGVYRKMYLPNYGVFDEERYFRRGERPLNIVLGGVKVGLGICEDIWYPDGPATIEARAGAELLVNINASPYHLGKNLLREELLSTRAVDNEAVVAYVNMVGGQDELVFDGRSMVVGADGEGIFEAKAFKEELIVTDLSFEGVSRRRRQDKERKKKPEASSVEEVTLSPQIKKTKPPIAKAVMGRKPVPHNTTEEVLGALELGTSDYAKKNGFKRAVIGLSGGIDSALVLAVAAGALGAENITAVFMPSKYTSKASVRDARRIAENFGVDFMEIPIDGVFDDYLKLLKPAFKGKKRDIAEENLQARTRGNIIMALSNKFGWLVLTTGNKSEMSVGYATLYGDMAGGFAVIKDVPKGLVYELSEHINERAGAELIPNSIITKEPSAELSTGQKDSDSLPPYDVLDGILKCYVEDDMSVEEIVARGYTKRLVTKIVAMVDRSEYKRRQAPPGVKITPKAFGRDRRMPITNRYESK